MDVDLHLITKYFAESGPALLLESQSETHPCSRISYLAALPKAEISARDSCITISVGGRQAEKKGNPWDALQTFRNRQNDWLFGYLGYDLKNHTENLHSQNRDKIGAADLYFMVPQFLLKFNHRTSDYELLKGKVPSDIELESVTQSRSSPFELRDISFETTKREYMRQISEVQHRIAEGEFYELNLSHQLMGKYTGSPFELYRQMKKVGAVPFGAFLKNNDIAVCCQSPERFLRKKGRTVFSQPIKGTSERGLDTNEDKSLKKRLISSPKERAENLMIVDLVRNDLSRIARPGSVRVPALFEIESFGTVHQMVSTIQAEAEQSNPVAILKACFPMGSMTGAPKISTMRTIEELEGYRRGIYSGAIGYISPTEDFDFNVVIRTAILKNNTLFYSIGGAITCDSDLQDEWEETLTKSRALTLIQSYAPQS